MAKFIGVDTMRRRRAAQANAVVRVGFKIVSIVSVAIEDDGDREITERPVAPARARRFIGGRAPRNSRYYEARGDRAALVKQALAEKRLGESESPEATVPAAEDVAPMDSAHAICGGGWVFTTHDRKRIVEYDGLDR